MQQESIKNLKEAQKRKLIEDDDRPVLFPFCSVSEFEELILEEYPIDNQDSLPTFINNGNASSHFDDRMDEDDHKENNEKEQIVAQFKDNFNNHALCLSSPEQSIIPRKRENLLLQLSDLHKFVEIVDISFNHKNKLWNKHISLHNNQHVSSINCLYLNMIKLANRYWLVYTERRCSLDKDTRSLWWIILCRLWLHISWEWKESNEYLLNVYNTWTLKNYMSNTNVNTANFFNNAIDWFNLRNTQKDGNYLHTTAMSSNNILDPVIIDHIDNANGHIESNINYEAQASASNIKLKLQSDKYINNKKRTIDKMKMCDTVTLLFDIHTYWREVYWTPNMELLMVCLWRRICVFIFDLSSSTVKCMDHPFYIKSDKSVRMSFIRDTEAVLWRHLITIEAHWFLIRNNIKKDVLSNVLKNPGTVPEGVIDEYLYNGHYNVENQITLQEHNDFCRLIKNVLEQPECGKLIKNSFQNNAFVHFLFPGEMENHILHDSRLDRKPQSVISLCRKSDFDDIAEFIQDEKLIDLILSIITEYENDKILKYASNISKKGKEKIGFLNSNTDNISSSIDNTINKVVVEPEFKTLGITILPSLIYNMLHALNNISHNTTESVIHNLVYEEIEKVYSTDTLFNVEMNINQLYNKRKQIILNNKDRSTIKTIITDNKDNDCYAKMVLGLHLEEFQVKPLENVSSWFWLENIRNETDTIKDIPIAYKLISYIKNQQKTIDSRFRYPFIINIRGEFWIIDDNKRFFARTRSLLQAFKWFILRLAFISPKQYSLLGDIILVRMFENPCKNIANIRTYIDENWIKPFSFDLPDENDDGD